MNSLSAHLTAGSRHGRLRFHPDCPMCRSQRLAGALPDALLPTRVQAGLLAAALAAGTAVPPAAAAAGPEADPGSPAEASQNPPAAPAPDAPPLGTDEVEEPALDEAPDVRELLTNPDLGSDAQGEDVGAEEEIAEPVPAPMTQAPTEPAPAEPAPVTAVPPPVDPVPTPVPVEAQPPVAVPEEPVAIETPRRSKKEALPERKAGERRQVERVPVESAPQPEPSPMPAVETVTATAAPATVPVSQPAVPTGAIAGPTYTIQPGDSLWSIARRVLGGNPSVGQIAREVNRLWELNRERIGTGNPSLIHAGIVLRLR